MERRPFGVINERQVERMNHTNGIDGIKNSKASSNTFSRRGSFCSGMSNNTKDE